MTETKTAIDRIHEFNRFGMVLGLERMEELLKRLGDPQEGISAIHIAGTNGKGSVSKLIDCALRSCGYRTGLFTSPYIERFNERIQYCGEEISDEDLERCARKVLDAAEDMVRDGLESPTEFEVVTAVMFVYFAEKNVDIAVLEVGLGGRGDSTNVLKEPLACVITSISYDHMDRLGDTLEEIASEKAGIIKKGCPVIMNVKDHGAARVIAKKAYETGSRLYDISRIRYEIYDDSALSQKVSMELYEKDYSGFEMSMVGTHQAENLKTALATLEILRREHKIKLDREKLREGIKDAKQPGRFEIMDRNGKTVILDGAHNAAGAQALSDTVKKYFPEKKILMITGMLRDKQTDRITDAFTGITKDMIATEPDNPRKLEAEELAELLHKKGADAVTVKDAGDALALSEKMMDDHDVLLTAGSLYLIGVIRRMIKDERRQY